MNSKEKKIGVSKITIQMGDKEATLTVEQARELQTALNALLGEKVIERVVEGHIYSPYIYPRWTYTENIPPVTISGITTGNTGCYTIHLNGDPDPLLVS